MNPTEPLTVFNSTGFALILPTLTLALLIWIRRRRSCALEFDWSPPDNSAALDDQDYSFCGYENRFAYALGSLVSQPFETSKPAKTAKMAYSANHAEGAT